MPLPAGHAAPASRLVCRDYGDAGLLVDVVAETAEQRWARSQALGEALRREQPHGVVDVVACFDTVFIGFDPLNTDRRTLEALVADLADRVPQVRPSRRFEVPVVYGGTFGPDLQATADLLGLRPGELVEQHSAQDWVVRFVGSPAGAPMMDGPRLPASVPRLAVPRPRVPRGSVGVSGFQSVIYNAASPGGWRLIGRTPAVLFDLGRPPHVAYRAGDRIRFRPVAEGDWERWTAHRLQPEEASA